MDGQSNLKRSLRAYAFIDIVFITNFAFYNFFKLQKVPKAQKNQQKFWKLNAHHDVDFTSIVLKRKSLIRLLYSVSKIEKANVCPILLLANRIGL